MIVVALMALATAVAPADPVSIDLWNDLAEDVVVTVPGAAATTVPHTKDVTFTSPADVKTFTIRFKGCDYPFSLPGPLEDYRSDGTGPVRLYLSDAVELYIVPPDLILQTPPGFLDPRQSDSFPLYPGKPVCKAS